MYLKYIHLISRFSRFLIFVVYVERRSEKLGFAKKIPKIILSIYLLWRRKNDIDLRWMFVMKWIAIETDFPKFDVTKVE